MTKKVEAPSAKIWERPAPDYLYRYMPLSSEEHWTWLERVLIKNELYFSSPLDFNDPFDCLPRILAPKTKAARQLRIGRDRRRIGGFGHPAVADAAARSFLRMKPAELTNFASQAFRETIGDIGIACLSEHWDNVLMWSHYASRHRGVCLRFATRDWPLDDPMLLPVHYQDERPVLNFPSKPSVNRIEELFTVLLRKACFWSEEREWRWLVNKAARKYVEIHPAMIDGVLVGALMDPAHLARLTKMLGKRNETELIRLLIDPEHFKVVCALSGPPGPRRAGRTRASR